MIEFEQVELDSENRSITIDGERHELHEDVYLYLEYLVKVVVNIDEAQWCRDNGMEPLDIQ